jgi:glycosyltransferase involved in cell wall biosynthesis
VSKNNLFCNLWDVNEVLHGLLQEDYMVDSAYDQKPIRVMRIISRMNIGGPALQISGLMRGLNSEEFEHRLYTGFCAQDEEDYLEKIATDVNAHRIEGFGKRVNFRADLRAFIALMKEIRNFKPHIIHTHTAKAGVLGRVASILSLQKSIRVHTYHGHLLSGYFGTFKTTLVIKIEKLLAYFTHRLLAVGDRVRQDLLDVGVGSLEKFELMPPGLTISTLPKKSVAIQSLNLSIGKLQCGFIGRVTQIKRPDRFLDVVSEIKYRGIDLHFFMAGDGELLQKCRERIIKENLPVMVLGWQSNIEMVLSSADIVLLTSDNEGTPLSLIQAGMAGLPVIATNVGSVANVVTNGVTGIITALDITEIADALEKLAGDKDLRDTLGLNASEFTLANFSVERLVHDHEELYRKLVSNQAMS